MEKTKQLIKELQVLIDKEEMNEIIKEKMMDMWRDAYSNATKEYVVRINDFNLRQKAGLSKEEEERMNESHFWDTPDENDCDQSQHCLDCGIDEREMFECPQFCKPKKVEI